MNLRHPLASIPLTLLLATASQAYTDANAELKEAAPARLARVVITGKAATPPARTAWVPTSPKRLDRLTPDMPPLHGPAQALASADVRAAARR